MSNTNLKIEAAAKIIKRKFPAEIDLVNTNLMNRAEAILHYDGEGNYCYAVLNSGKTKLLIDFFYSCNTSIERIENDWVEFPFRFSFSFLDDLATVIGRIR